MELCYRYSNYKQKEIGALFGVDYSTVSQNWGAWGRSWLYVFPKEKWEKFIFYLVYLL